MTRELQDLYLCRLADIILVKCYNYKPHNADNRPDFTRNTSTTAANVVPDVGSAGVRLILSLLQCELVWIRKIDCINNNLILTVILYRFNYSNVGIFVFNK